MALGIHEETDCMDRLDMVRKSADEESEKSNELHFIFVVRGISFQFCELPAQPGRLRLRPVTTR
jgi:hypothetical protein